nr:MAG TPA: hypothetical protein [Caudoviricetes sp.]
MHLSFLYWFAFFPLFRRRFDTGQLSHAGATRARRDSKMRWVTVRLCCFVVLTVLVCKITR